MHIGGGNVDGQEKAKRINEHGAFASFHALESVKTADPGGFLDRFDALRIHDRRTRLCVPAHSLALGLSQGREQTKPGPFETQATKMIEYGLPGWKVRWQVAPRATRAQHVKERVEDGSQRVSRWSTTSSPTVVDQATPFLRYNPPQDLPFLPCHATDAQYPTLQIYLCFRYLAGGMPTSRLKALRKATSESYPSCCAILPI